jgi:hypothetical protein
MAPSIETPIQIPVVDTIKEKLAAINVTEVPAPVEVEAEKPVEAAPAVEAPVAKEEAPVVDGPATLLTGHKEPLKLAGVLNQFKQFDTTPIIGTEFPEVDLVDWIEAPNADELLRDLAITGMPSHLH